MGADLFWDVFFLFFDCLAFGFCKCFLSSSHAHTMQFFFAFPAVLSCGVLSRVGLGCVVLRWGAVCCGVV